MYKIRLLNKISPLGMAELEKYGCAVSETIEDPDAVIVRSAEMSGFELTPSIKCVARAGVGTNNIPISRCTDAGIAVFNTPGANAEAVKELVICALLMSSRDVLGGIEWVRSIAGYGAEIPTMVERGKSSFAGPEISGKTLGVVGLGAVGAKIANAALAMGMRVYGYDPYLSVDAAWQLSGSVIKAASLDVIYKNCDYITLHVPYLEDTHHMIDARAFAKMKDGVRLVNLARGELVCDADLMAALDTAKVARYVTDFPNESTAGAPNVVPMPHLGASTPESEEKCALMAVRATLDYLDSGNVSNSVNLPSAYMDRSGSSRLCVIHLNVPRMLNSFLELIGTRNINVERMVNESRGEIAYTIIDTGAGLDEDAGKRIASMPGVLRVRVL